MKTLNAVTGVIMISVAFYLLINATELSGEPEDFLGIAVVYMLSGMCLIAGLYLARSLSSKLCPLCLERVKTSARICRHCGHTFKPLNLRQSPISDQLGSAVESHPMHKPSEGIKRFGIMVGIVAGIAWIIFLIKVVHVSLEFEWEDCIFVGTGFLICFGLGFLLIWAIGWMISSFRKGR